MGASDWDTVDRDQMGGEKPVSLIDSPMSQTFCGVVTMKMRNANRVSEVKCENLVQR